MNMLYVIIVTYNGMQWYRECFDSLRNSSVPVKTIVIDNNSTDGTCDYIRNNYPEIHLIENHENLGFGKANNIGLKIAFDNNADYAFLLNQDAWIEPDSIEKLIKKMEQNPQYGILSPLHLAAGKQALDLGFTYYITPESCPDLISDYIAKGRAEDKVYPVKFVNAAMWLISKNCLMKIGGFDPLFPHYGEDMDYICRSHYHQLRLGIYPYARGVHDRPQKRRTPNTFTKQKHSYIINGLIVLKNIDQPFYLCIWRCFMPNIGLAFKKLFNGSLRSSLAHISSLFVMTGMLPSVYKNRKISSKEGPAFL